MKMIEQNDYQHHLENQQYSSKNIYEQLSNLKRLEVWKQQNDYINEALNYQELLSYVNHLQNRKLKAHTINLQLHSISNYYEYLKKYAYITTNPAKTIRVNNTAKTVHSKTFTMVELENIYQSYIHYKNNTKRKNTTASQHQYTQNKYILTLSLLIYQGLHTGELSQLQISEIDLSKGVINIGSTKRSNTRLLALAPVQILPLSKHLESQEKSQRELFKENPRSSVSAIIQELKGIEPQIENAKQLRTSVIIAWLKKYGKRKSQYLIGHKYISSTEKYEQQNLEGLTDLLKKHHPFG